MQQRVVFLKNREIPRAEGGINEGRKAVGCCLRPRSVQKANQPQGQFLAYGKLHGVGKDIRIRNVGYLVERLVFSTHLYCNLTIYLEISLTLSVLNGVAGGQLIDNETFTKGTYLMLCSECIECVGIMEVHFVGLLHLGHRLIVCI